MMDIVDFIIASQLFALNMPTSPSSACQSPPLVSVIIPCHNYGRFLGEAIESVRGQTYQHWECIIVDDGSTDNSRQVALGHRKDSRIRYIYQGWRGVSAARNVAIVESTGKYLQFLDADDLIESGKLRAQVDYLEANPCADLVYGDSHYFHEGVGHGGVIDVAKRMPFPRISERGEKLLTALVRRNIMVVSAPLLRRAEDGTELFNPGLRGHEDWEYWIRLALKGRTFHFFEADDTKALIRVHSRSTVQDPIPMLLSNLQVRQGLCQMPLNHKLHGVNRRGISLQLAKLAKAEFRNRCFKTGLQHAVMALQTSHWNPLMLFFLFTPEILATHMAIIANRLAR